MGHRVSWIDGKGRHRSPLEPFTLLTPEARSALESDRARQFTVWEIGVLSGQGAAYSKPQAGVPSHGAEAELFAVGVDDAPGYHAALSPLWCELMRVFTARETERVFLSDNIRDARGEEWIDFAEAARSGLIAAPVPARVAQRRDPLYTAEMTGPELCALVEQWWPSGLGMLAGIALDPADGAPEGPDAGQPLIGADHLARLRHYFHTARSFDNLGLVVLSRGALWRDVARAVTALGWEPLSGDAVATPPQLPLLFRQASPT